MPFPPRSTIPVNPLLRAGNMAYASKNLWGGATNYGVSCRRSGS